MSRLGFIIVVITLFASACSSGSSGEVPTTTLPTTTAPATTTAPTTTEAPTTTAAPTTTTTTAAPAPTELTIRSPLYKEGTFIPAIITCEGDDVSPQLDIEGLPADTVSMVVIMDDPDAPVGVWDHWVVFDIVPVESIPQGAEDLGTLGSNSWGNAAYGGPCPPPGDGPHRYITAVYALDVELGLDTGATKDEVLEAMADNILLEGSLLGYFER